MVEYLLVGGSLFRALNQLNADMHKPLSFQGEDVGLMY